MQSEQAGPWYGEDERLTDGRVIYRVYHPDELNLADYLNRQQAAITEAIRALGDYGEHSHDCDWRRNPEILTCSCGLHAALDQLRAIEGAQ